ncbi:MULTISPECIES: 5-oxoprolinase subunit PxpA [Deinococcus]|uniref:LamB/YcsF n=1 Tax=Deinococcus geothermalis (strain DSM 11300 / CIP 105573 / AG-3a) TaxID=319795 RepID=Q1IXD6_DEIGD|nr:MULTISPECIES: 5-oxoprolinase subunit PxpA [Deinococcus]ABF46098.1 LamB/YcsF [Deinococcus geothermalis DSM 11300]TDE85883.1 5-oxoprolinase subunit PxpA [Deinococcus sp. S9]
MPHTIDLNADLGEGSPHEAAIMPHVTSANIACGGHAGDAETMRDSLRLAARHGVEAGAHPGFPDREGFGRRELHFSSTEVTAFVREQIEALKAVAAREGVQLRHVKPHGMLYNMAVRDAVLAMAIAQAAAASGLPLYFGLAGEASVMLREAEALGLTAVGEGFADRGYAPDGSLWPRSQAGALLPHDEAVRQGVRLALTGTVTAVTGEPVRVPARTLCLHGDGAEAAELARDLRQALEAAGVRVAAPA